MLRPMFITPVDAEKNLFRITDVFPSEFTYFVENTDWLQLPWNRQEGQENWKRRRIDETVLPWIDSWHDHFRKIWPTIEKKLGIPIQPYSGTAFWLDEPGFTCALHTDGELPGSLHLTWKGPGTSFYWYKDADSLRYEVPEQPNAGYIMINRETDGYRKLLWHAMLTPVPADSFRLTTYTWIIPR